VTDAQLVDGSNQGQAQQFRISPNPRQELRLREPEIFQAGVDIGFAFVIEKLRQAETLHETMDFAGRHGLLLQIHKLNFGAPLLEKALGGPGRLRIFHPKDLNTRHAVRF